MTAIKRLKLALARRDIRAISAGRRLAGEYDARQGKRNPPHGHDCTCMECSAYWAGYRDYLFDHQEPDHGQGHLG